LGSLELWWMETLKTFGRDVPRDDLRLQYTEYLTAKSPQTRTINAREFTVQFRQYCLVIQQGALIRRGPHRTTYIPVPTLTNARKQWIQTHGPTDWAPGAANAPQRTVVCGGPHVPVPTAHVPAPTAHDTPTTPPVSAATAPGSPAAAGIQEHHHALRDLEQWLLATIAATALLQSDRV
jgi:hypothetical protein